MSTRYTREQLTEIVKTRLEGLDVFTADAIELCSRKVAAVSGDARRALDLCRRAAELAQKRGGSVGLEDIRSALGEMSSSPIVAAMENCALHEQLFLVRFRFERVILSLYLLVVCWRVLLLSLAHCGCF